MISNCSWQKKKNLPKYRTSTAAVISLFCFIDIPKYRFSKICNGNPATECDTKEKRLWQDWLYHTRQSVLC